MSNPQLVTLHHGCDNTNMSAKKLTRSLAVKRKYVWKTDRKNKGKLYDSRKDDGKNRDNDDSEATGGTEGGKRGGEMI